VTNAVARLKRYPVTEGDGEIHLVEPAGLYGGFYERLL